MVTRLTEADPARLSAGQPMDMVVVPVRVDDDGRRVVTYAFAPRGEPMTDVDIAGVGIHPFGRFEDRTITDMGVAAVRGRAGRGRRGHQGGSKPPSAPPPTAGWRRGTRCCRGSA